MPKLKITKTTPVIEQTAQWSCEFCKRTFLRESTVARHICETKHRWNDLDRPFSRIAYSAWLQFYETTTPSKKSREKLDFIKSPYYSGFTKFGLYCVSAKVLNVSRFVDWLLKNKIRLESWCSDSVYSNYLQQHLREEDPLDAINRSIETTKELSVNENIQSRDYLRWGNHNIICYNITTGRISPWILYHSTSGNEFLNKLDSANLKMIFDYINPELWSVRFKRYPELVAQVSERLQKDGY